MRHMTDTDAARLSMRAVNFRQYLEDLGQNQFQKERQPE